MEEAKEYALEESRSHRLPTGAVVVKDGEVVGRGANGNEYHEENGCDRHELREKGELESGEGYDLCPGCSYEFHCESRAIEDAREKGVDLEDADLYLWGHWWLCRPCLDKVEEAGISDVYLVENAEEKFSGD